MHFLDAKQIKQALPWQALIEAIRETFAKNPLLPPRQHLHVPRKGIADATLLLMPAWADDGIIGTKIASVFPSNADIGKPAVSAIYIIQNGKTGEVEAVADGAELTARRTAAASALASQYLSRENATTLLVCGTGKLAANFVEAHCAVRSIKKVLLWGRTPANVQKLLTQLKEGSAVSRLDIQMVARNALQDAVEQANIISCVTMSSEPLFDGNWVQAGTHIDLAGAYRPDMRESDDALIRKTDIIAVDSREGALKEGGDLVQPLNAGLITHDQVQYELSELATADQLVRKSAQQITLFKSVGHSLLDYAAAGLLVDKNDQGIPKK